MIIKEDLIYCWNQQSEMLNQIVEQALPLPPKFSDSKTGAYFALLQSGNWNPAINSNLFPFSAGTYTLIPATEDPNGLN